VGGDTDKDGLDNIITNNYIDNNSGYSLKIMREPQKQICGNVTTSKKEIYPKNSKYKESAFKPCR